MHLAMTMLGVSDIERSRTFYVDTLGFAERMRIADYVILDAGGSAICLSGPLGKKAAGSTTAAPVELVLGVESVNAAYERLSGRGVTFETTPHELDGTNHVAHFRDPDGHLFSLYGLP